MVTPADCPFGSHRFRAKRSIRGLPHAYGAERTIVAILAEGGDAETAEILRHYIHHPGLGELAIAAIKAIESQTDTTL